jgi:lipopolysaccharide transport system ATP-binding protein
MGDIAIRVENISKSYKIASARQRHDTLRDQVMDGLKSVLWPPRRSNRGTRAREVFWALRNVSFQAQRGDTVGIIGRNGAGKSTLLKILSRITEPSSGRIEIYGRVGSLLEVGTGFDSELTGLENIYLSGAILGMKKAEIDRKLDEIIAFSEVEKFIDTPVKRYSSGMYVRLAFAVAAHLEPEILIVDEVLAVGDATFQRKCLGKMGDVANEGRTVLFVSHNMAAITRLCQWGIWLDQGQLKGVGPAPDVVASYFAAGVQALGELTFHDRPAEAPGSEFIRLLAVRLRSADGRVTTSIDARSSFNVEIEYDILRPVSSLRIGFSVSAHDGTVVFSSMDADSLEDKRSPGHYINACTIPGAFLNHGQYFLSAGSDTPMIQSHFFVDRGLSFTIDPTGGIGGHIADGRQGLLRLALPWTVDRLV